MPTINPVAARPLLPYTARMGFEFNHPLFRPVALALFAGLVVMIAFSLLEAALLDALLLAVFAAAALWFLQTDRLKLPSLFSVLFIVAALLNGAGWAYELWKKIPGYDPFTHAYTTFAITLALGYLAFHSVRIHFVQRRLLFVVSIASFGIALGVLWELFEWSAGIKQDYTGITVDLAMDAGGALAAAILAATELGASRAREQR